MLPFAFAIAYAQRMSAWYNVVRIRWPMEQISSNQLNTDRSQLPVVKTTLAESGYRIPPGTPEDWVKMVWPLTCEAWAMKGEPVDESRLLRHVVRIQRGPR